LTAAAKFLVIALGLLAGGAADASSLQPFVAQYQAKYTWLSVGDIRLELKRDDVAARWILESRGDPSGLARLVASAPLVQTSWIQVDGDRVRPIKFRFDDGSDRATEDISIGFDWKAGRATGTSKGRIVDLELPANAQDPVSFQFAMMIALQNGREPGPLTMVDSPKPGTYEQTFLRKETIKTPAGTFETVVYNSGRPGASRQTTMWLAPSLGYLAVQIEQYRKGKKLFAMYLEKYRSGD
jgi:hypothetical protein